MSMSTFIRHQKENERWNAIQTVLEEKFDGNPIYLKDAEEYYDDHTDKIKKFKNTSNILSSIVTVKEGPSTHKTSVFDLVNEQAYLFYPVESSAILSYTIDTLGYKRIFPTSISSLMNKNIGSDYSKSGTSDRKENVKEIEKFLRNFCSRYNLTVNKIDKNVKTGTIQFETTQYDQVYGATRQFITLVIDKTKKFSIKDIKNNVDAIARDYTSLFSYFSLFGFSEIFSRCSCKNYLTKYNKKRGIQNYCCSHLMYSMSIFPHYLVSVLGS